MWLHISLRRMETNDFSIMTKLKQFKPRFLIALARSKWPLFSCVIDQFHIGQRMFLSDFHGIVGGGITCTTPAKPPHFQEVVRENLTYGDYICC